MGDRFDIQRKLDHASDEAVDDARQRLGQSRDAAMDSHKRLVRLDESHYFDPVEKRVLRSQGGKLSDLGHSPSYLRRAAERLDGEARAAGYAEIEGGLWWDAASRRLYVRNGDRYVLYSLDRRKKRGRARAEAGPP